MRKKPAKNCFSLSFLLYESSLRAQRSNLIFSPQFIGGVNSLTALTLANMKRDKQIIELLVINHGAKE